MKKYILAFLTIHLMLLKTYSQEKLSKEEIAITWKKNLRNDQDGLKKIELLPIDDTVKNILLSINTNYDTVGVFFISQHGTVSLDRCHNGNIPSDIYVFWRNFGRVYLQEMTNHCVEPPEEIKEETFFDFFEKNKKEIAKEEILPVITGARKEGEEIIYNQVITSHEPSYLLFCKLGDFSKTLFFSENGITNSQGLFYTDNLNSKSYQWFLHAKNDVAMH